MSIRHLIISSFFNSSHVQRNCKVHDRAYPQNFINFFHHTVKYNFLQFQIGYHTKSHRRTYGNIRGCFLKHFIRFVAHGYDFATLGRNHVLRNVAFISNHGIDLDGTASKVYSICFFKQHISVPSSLLCLQKQMPATGLQKASALPADHSSGIIPCSLKLMYLWSPITT